MVLDIPSVNSQQTLCLPCYVLNHKLWTLPNWHHLCFPLVQTSRLCVKWMLSVVASDDNPCAFCACCRWWNVYRTTQTMWQTSVRNWGDSCYNHTSWYVARLLPPSLVPSSGVAGRLDSRSVFLVHYPFFNTSTHFLTLLPFFWIQISKKIVTFFSDLRNKFDITSMDEFT